MKKIINFKTRVFFRLSILFLCMFFVVNSSAKSQPKTDTIIDTLTQKDVYLLVGELESIRVHTLSRISIVDPNIADIANATENEILLLGQKEGETAIFLWDEYGKRAIIIHVCERDLDIVKKRLENIFETSGIHEVSLKISEDEGKVVMLGDLPEEKKETFEKVIAPYENNLLNLVNDEELKDLIEIDLQVTELSTTLYKELGVDWEGASSDSGAVVLNYEETMPSTDGSIADYFKIGDFNRTSSLVAGISALIEEGKGRILSKPKIVVMNGEEASFLVGGEIPIRTTTQADGQTQENITFKEYGISFSITPEIKKVNDETVETQHKKIDVQMNLEISDIDQANAVGDDVAFNTRSITTHLFLDDKQSIIMAGLIKTSEGQTLKKIPGLWRIPVLGWLFTRESMPAANSETELVIQLTPYIIQDQEKGIDSEITGSLKAEDFTEPLYKKQKEEDLLGRNQGNYSYGEEKEAEWDTDQEEGIHSEITGPLRTEDLTEPIDKEQKDEDLSEGTQGASYYGEDKEAEWDNDQGFVGEVEVEAPTVTQEEEQESLGQSQTLEQYIKDVQNMISKEVVYPSEAWEQGIEGTVVLEMLILKDGTLAFVLVKESSGYDVFDEYALDAARRILSYPAFPSGIDLQEVNLIIPIVYSLEN